MFAFYFTFILQLCTRKEKIVHFAVPKNGKGEKFITHIQLK